MGIEVLKSCASRGETDGRYGGKSREQLAEIIRDAKSRESNETTHENKSTSYPRGMREAIESLNVQIDNLSDEFLNLAKQLEPLLSQGVPKASDESTQPNVSVSRFVDAIEGASDKLVDMRIAMNGLADRLRL